MIYGLLMFWSVCLLAVASEFKVRKYELYHTLEPGTWFRLYYTPLRFSYIHYAVFYVLGIAALAPIMLILIMEPE